MTCTRVTIAALLALLAAPRPAAGQERDGSNPSGLGATRQALAARAARLEQTGQPDAVREAAAIGARLARGDFRVGDRILLSVQGEKELSDTFTVGLGGQLTLPLIGNVPLEGVLRSERDGKPIWDGKALQQAIAEGRTLDDAGLVAGDQFIVRRRSGATAGEVLRFVGVLVTIPVTIYTLARLR